MKPQQAFAGSITGNIEPTEEIGFTLDDSAEGRAHLISVLTDLYTDQELACVREYATNARDANIEAGNGHIPIQISLPNSLSPWYVIKDNGPGLDAEGLREVFAKYGASTKRGSNDYNGTFGLGGKAALTYTSQFTIIGVRNSVKTNVIVNRREDGIGVMKVISQEPTKDANGVEIRIPVKDRNSFGSKARDFFYYWKAGTVEVDGVQPKHLYDRKDMAKVGDNAFLITGGGYQDRDVVVMGNVAYKLPDRQLAEAITSNYGASVVYFVEIGDVALAPSREGLQMSPKTAAKLDAIKQELKDSIKGQIEHDLKSVKSYSEAFSVWSRWKRVMGSDKLPAMKYKGQAFINQIREPHWIVGIGNGRYRQSTNDYGNTRHERTYCDLSELLAENMLIVTNYQGAGPTPTQMLKIEQYLESVGSSIDQVMLFRSMPGKPWTGDVANLDWSVIDAIKVKRAQGVGGRTGTIPVQIYRSGGSYSYRRGYGDKGKWDTVTQLDPAERILYLSPTDVIEEMTKIHNIHAVFPNTQIVALGANRWVKFVRENPTAVEMKVYYRNTFSSDLKASMTANELFFADHDEEWRALAKWIGTGSNCPILTKLAGIKVDKAKIDVYNGVVKATKSCLKAYPLVASRYYNDDTRHDKKHIILYINAVISEG